MKRLLCLFLLLGLCVYAYVNRIELLQKVGEPYLEKTLTHVFGMPVEIDNLEIDPKRSYVRMDQITFSNQPEFRQDLPHFQIKNFEFDLDFKALRHKEVRIKKAVLGEFIYFIDRIMTDEGPRNNVITWWHHMKSLRRVKSSPEEPDKKKWIVDIRHFDLHNGTFIFHERSKSYDAKYVFRELEGHLTGLYFPTADPAVLTEDVYLKGVFGEFYPTPFEAGGKSNFSTKKVSFDLKGTVRDGNILDFPQMWAQSPVEAREGAYDLDAHVTCVERMMESTNVLTLKDLKVVTGDKVTDKIWGVPTKAWIGFVQDQKKLVLEVPWTGEVSSPEFDIDYAFRNAFHESLARKTKASFAFFTEGPVKVASLAAKASTSAAEGIGKVIQDVVNSENKKTSEVQKDVL